MDLQALDFEQLSQDYQRVEEIIRYLEENYPRQPELKELAAQAGLSEYHLQRVFARWVGISPKRFLQFLTKESAKRLLAGSASVLEATYQAGLSGPGRLHDLFISTEAVTPGEYKRRGAGLRIAYGIHPTPFGECLLAATERGICHLAFIQNNDHDLALQELATRWEQADLYLDPAGTQPIVQQVFAYFSSGAAAPLHLHLLGTNFQIKVWEALLRVPPGSAVSYADIAEQIGESGSARAVGQAVGRNPLPVLIPCHRVIRRMGEFGDYRWGSVRKKALLGWEAAHWGPSV